LVKALNFSDLPYSIPLEGKSPDEKLAWRFLLRLIWDTKRGPRKMRRGYVAEVLRWMEDDAREARYYAGDEGFEYTFGWWCDVLGVDEGYMKRKMEDFLK